jgi:hypothetical protein
MDYFEVITNATTGEQTIRPFTPEEIAALAPTADEIRAQRNALLSACDWTQLADAPVDDLAWAVYRQALRDIPDQPGFPANVVWPVAPS